MGRGRVQTREIDRSVASTLVPADTNNRRLTAAALDDMRARAQ
jgi:hypothetical protein